MTNDEVIMDLGGARAARLPGGMSRCPIGFEPRRVGIDPSRFRRSMSAAQPGDPRWPP
jgi:hypothetical protein